MGHKIHPKGFRIGPLFGWDSRWFATDKQYKFVVVEDTLIRRNLLKKLAGAGVAKIEIERSINKITFIIHVVRPGMVIGRGGAGLEELKKYITKQIVDHRLREKQLEYNKTMKVELKIEPVKEPNLSAYFVATQIADQLARRLPAKRVCGFAIDKVMNSGAKGVKVMLAGRVGGAEISRRETYKQGSIPLSTIRENVDFAAIPSLTKSGYIGVKVWICKNS
jgi:small subunit ribosomal protein S3